jgi:hypothetical protein
MAIDMDGMRMNGGKGRDKSPGGKLCTTKEKWTKKKKKHGKIGENGG